METQLKRLGASCDWSRFRFTLNPEIVKVVYSTFKKLSDDGMIYRGERIVNYCVKCGTAYSQLEVDSVEQDDSIYYLDYGSIVIATTRPETIFADVAVAVNPKDKRYSKLVGLTAKIPLINREVPVIEDNLVDKEFGTGALKITPGHDQTDFEVGQRHNLQIISVIDKSGKMINCPEKYIGMKASVAREEVVKDLEEAGFVKKVEKIHHTVGTCYRDHSILEPMISSQWFIKVEPLAIRALDAIKDGEVKFAAKKYEKIAIHWLKNLRDWNVSRQIVWGLRIPAWKCEDCNEWTITNGEKPSVCSKCNSKNISQDSDTFDTWFSSGQWPFATLKTTKPGDFEKFYPTSVMETGYDILPFWVIRMLMLGIYATGKVPFKNILLHGLVRDKDGQKISKSKGNVVDPIEMADRYGADALRMGLLWGSLIENDVCLSEQNINAQRKFANKLWNLARFVKLSFSNKNSNKQEYKTAIDEDSKLIKTVNTLIKEVSCDLDKYKLNEAVEKLYGFVWNDLANGYVEGNKERFKNNDLSARTTLNETLEKCLKLLHPFMPFVTEAIWKEIGHDQMLITSSWPTEE
ncbi:MAG: valine--tRNA ligase [Bacteroidales bacterium]|nr:valine--tRNA ligase [Bacteroidales bacterium]